MGVEQGGGEKATQKRSYDADDRGDDDAAGIVSRHDCLGDRSGEKTQDDKRDDSHGYSRVDDERSLPQSANDESTDRTRVCAGPMEGAYLAQPSTLHRPPSVRVEIRDDPASLKRV